MIGVLVGAAVKAILQAILGLFGYVPKAAVVVAPTVDPQEESTLNVVNKSVVAGANVSAKLDGMPDVTALRDSLKGDPNSLD